MHSPDAWLLQIYRMSDATAHSLTAGLLAAIDDIAVEAAADEDNHYIVVESSDDDRAAAVADLIRAVDPGARLMHTSTPASGRSSAA